MLKTVCVSLLFSAVIGQSAQECNDDDRGVWFNNDLHTCSDLIDAHPGICVTEGNRQACCKSCERKKSSDPTCPYGDIPEITIKSTEWGRGTKMTCPEAIEKGFSCHKIKSLCCATCKTLETGDPNCPYQDSPMVMTTSHRGEKIAKKCSEMVGGRACADDAFKKHCCNACKSLETVGVPGCPYRDVPINLRDPKTRTFKTVNCSGHVGGHFCSQADVRQQCCNTCKGLETGDADCPYGDVIASVFNVRSLGGEKQWYTCTELVANLGYRMCDRITVQRSCCAACKSRPAGKRDVEEFEEADVLDITEAILVD